MGLDFTLLRQAPVEADNRVKGILSIVNSSITEVKLNSASTQL